MNFIVNWMELENMILSEETQSQRTCMVCTPLQVDIGHKIQVLCYSYQPKRS